MKRIVTVVTVLFISLFFSFSGIDTYAVSDNSIFINNASSKNNRLLNIKVGAKSQELLSAGTFIIDYDTSVLEFREGKPAEKSCMFEYTEIGKGKIKGIFLSDKGANIRNGNNLFVLTFKAVKSGTGSVKISCDDCVNSSLKSIPNLKNAQGTITIEDNKIKITGVKSNNESYNNKNSHNIKDTHSNTLHTDNNGSFITENDKKAEFNIDSIISSPTPIVATVVITSTVILGFSLAFIIGRKRK